MTTNGFCFELLGEIANDDRRFDDDDFRIGRQGHFRAAGGRGFLRRLGAWHGRAAGSRGAAANAANIAAAIEIRSAAAVILGPLWLLRLEFGSRRLDRLRSGLLGQLDETNFLANLRFRRRRRNGWLGWNHWRWLNNRGGRNCFNSPARDPLSRFWEIQSSLNRRFGFGGAISGDGDGFRDCFNRGRGRRRRSGDENNFFLNDRGFGASWRSGAFNRAAISGWSLRSCSSRNSAVILSSELEATLAALMPNALALEMMSLFSKPSFFEMS